jgi:tetratricopeptide (TPR) repeat protein
MSVGRDGTGAAWIITGIALGGALLLTHASRLPYVGPTALALSLVPVGLLAARRHGGRPAIATIALAHLLAIGVWVLVDRGSDTAVDYYRFWGGSSRRLGDPTAAERAYRELTQIAPTEPAGHYQLGRLRLAHGDEASGLASLHEAQRLEPARARAWIAEATYLDSQGRTAQAEDKARAAVAAEPDHAEARVLLDRLTGTPRAARPAPRPAESPDAP